MKYCCLSALASVDQSLDYPWKLESGGNESV